MDQPYTSEELFHLVGWRSPADDERNFDTLCKVLQSGFVSAPPHRPEWRPTEIAVDLEKSLMKGELVVPVITCFADIPRDSLGIHVRKYGRFGLALSREYLVRLGARPVMYFPMSTHHDLSIYGANNLQDIEATFRGFQRMFSDTLDQVGKESERGYGAESESPEQVLDQIDSVFTKDFLAFIKPFDADLRLDDRSSYYMEREWRRLGNVGFEPSNVTRVIVASGYADRLMEAFPAYASKVMELPL